MQPMINFLSSAASAADAYRALCRPICKQHDLTQTGLDILLFLSNNPSYNRAKDIETLRGIKRPLASIAIDRLSSDGYLTREQDDKDKRSWRLVLTDKSKEVTEEGKLIQQQFGEALFSGFTTEERATFTRLGERLQDNMRHLGGTSC